MLNRVGAPESMRSHALLLGLILVGGAPAAQGSAEALAEAGGADQDTSGAVVEAPTQAEDLGLRVQGMEGKLRESAAARKAADQARMEAERRLAEAAQELTRVRAEIDLLRDANLALEARLIRAEREGQGAALGFSAREGQSHPLKGEGRDTWTLPQAARERPIDRLTEPQERGDETGRERLRALTQEQSALRRSLAERESDLKRTQVELRAVQAERDSLRRQLAGMRLVSPIEPRDERQDGSTLAQAGADAGVAAQAFRAALIQAQTSRAGEARRAAREAAQELQRLQIRVARLMGARGVYRVEPGDTYALIAERLYGDGRRWSEIQEANRGIAPDPSHLVPGLTLVLP